MALDNYPSSDSSPMFSKIRVGHLTLKNRIMMGPIVTGLEGDKDLSELAQFYSERELKGIPSLITVGGFSFSVLGGSFFLDRHVLIKTLKLLRASKNNRDHS